VTQFLVTGLSMVAFLTGLVLLALWARRRIGLLRPGALDPAMLQVVARTGLQANQGLTVVRVGRRYLLLASGEGGVRLLTELDEREVAVGATGARAYSLRRSAEDVAAEFEEDARRPLGGNPLPAPVHRSFARVWAGLGMSLMLATFALASPAQAPAQVPPSESSVVAPPDGPVGNQLGSIFEALPRVAVEVGDGEEGMRLSGTVGTVVVLGLMALAPTLLLLTTSFTRILVVLHLMRQALGTQNTPPSHLLAGLALLLSAAVMAPTLDQVRAEAVDPWLAGEIDEGAMIARAIEPMRYFMLSHTREADIGTFLRVSQTPPPMSPAEVPNAVLMSAFVTSELRTAFEIGFAVFLPFIVIDLVVAAVLTSMGMFMLPPTMIALPCKLMLFVLMDGWTLLLGTLADSFL
jgi:flagellar biosynthetic protein FliP